MKKLWVKLLAVLLFAALAMACAIAETNYEIIPDDDLDMDVQIEAADDGIILDDDLSLDISGLPTLEEDDNIMPDPSLEAMEPATVSASNATESNGNEEDFEIVDGKLVKYNGSGGNVTIPGSVTTIGKRAFDECYSLTGVIIPNSVTTIEDYAFDYCTNLTSVTIPASVTTMKEGVFNNCHSLKKATIPSGVTTIPAGLFFCCTNLTSVTIQGNIIYLKSGAFYNCSKLTSITIPNTVKNIGNAAFYECSSLKSVTIPDSVINIGIDVFYKCSNLTSITIGKKLARISNSILYGCDKLSNVTLLNGAMNISDDAFSGCPATMTFHTPCDSATTKLIEEKGYTVVKSEHNVVTEPAVAPTCTKAGRTERSHCSVCGKVLVQQKTVAAKGHTTVLDKAVAPTCTKTGLTVGSHCSVCGKVLVRQKTVPKLISIKKCSITGIKDAVYTGDYFKPLPAVRYGSNKLIKGTNYTVSYASNRAIGTATVTITGKGKYGESIKKTFRINPKAVALSSLTAGTKQLTVMWNRGTSITGYEVQYDLSKSFSKAKKVTVAKATTVKTVLHKLTTGKIYYVRIRAYKTVNGKKYYSTWSNAKAAKVK